MKERISSLRNFLASSYRILSPSGEKFLLPNEKLHNLMDLVKDSDEIRWRYGPQGAVYLLESDKENVLKLVNSEYLEKQSIVCVYTGRRHIQSETDDLEDYYLLCKKAIEQGEISRQAIVNNRDDTPRSSVLDRIKAMRPQVEEVLRRNP